MSIKTIIEEFLRHKKLLDDVERDGREASSPDSYDKEFSKLREMNQRFKEENTYPTTEGEKSLNVSKNRYKDIVPYDCTRVILKKKKDGVGSDYINASFIKGPIGSMRYIAAQGPMPKTVNEFWQMIWENKVRVIFMACREFEGDPKKLKCQRYWSDPKMDKMTFDNIEVTLEKEETTAYKEHLIRHMIATSNGESRKIVQLHYQEWPDRGVPRCIPGILDLIELMRNFLPSDAADSTPVLVHCSAGCGRTGTILVIDYIRSLLQLKKLDKNFKLFEIIAEMRRQRMAIVQSLEQYVFVHEAVAEMFTHHFKTSEPPLYYNNMNEPTLAVKQQAIIYETGNSTEYSLERPVETSMPKKPQTLPRKPVLDKNASVAQAISQAVAQRALGSPVKTVSPEYDTPLSVNTDSSLLEGVYSEPCTASNQNKPHALVHSKSKLGAIQQILDLYGTVAKTTADQPTMYTEVSKKAPDLPNPPFHGSGSKVNDTSEDKYAYADPYQSGKWSLQEIARGKNPSESAYSSIDYISPPPVLKPSATGIYEECAYAEPEEIAGLNYRDADAPNIPAKNYKKDDHIQPHQNKDWGVVSDLFKLIIPNASRQEVPSNESYTVGNPYYFRGQDISFANRVGKPRGKRPNKMAVS